MSRNGKRTFSTIRTEGAILPADLIQRIAEGEKGIGGLKPTDYYLAETEKLGEAISRSWNRLVGLWRTFKTTSAALPETDLGTALTRDRWLLPIFQELGYEKLPVNKAQEIGGKTYPISHMRENVPVHLVGFRLDLDRRTAGVVGAARTSPHSLVQEFLNRSHSHLWGFVSNGLQLRIIRDNVRLTRQAYVEFDLEGMFESEAFSDFSLLWLLCHRSRVDADKPEDCWLEKWSKTAQQEGTRALDELRVGVKNAITALGQGFLAHPTNGSLRDALRSGALDKQEYYRELLRLVYRLIFLFVAEDRDILLAPGSNVAARERYLRYYSMRRIREIAGRKRGSLHADLYEVLKLVSTKLGDPKGCPELALMPLGGFLWSGSAIPHVTGMIGNDYFLAAVRELSYRVTEGTLRSVDYKNLRSEELGSVYEALLELHPEINLEAAVFELKALAGHERKTSGSYYTPDSLVQSLLDSALEPVIQQKLEEVAKKTKQKDGKKSYEQEAEKAILSLKVCDPSSGSGHFLVAAAHRLAKRLAAVRTGDEEPSPEAYRTALRDVIGRCVYGVDINPMSAELCKVSLWLEAMEPGKPLSFLDHHIRVGNSLLGTTAELIAKGLPDDAFKPIEGDDKETCSKLKKRNKQERDSGQQDMLHMMVAEQSAEYNSIEAQTRGIDEAPDETLDEIKRKAEQFHRLVVSPEYQHAQQVADAWCAAFVWMKQTDVPFEPITTDTIRRIETDQNALTPNQLAEVERLSRQYLFFHWHLAFPEVFTKGGFDCVLGNPPWEMVELSEKEFFMQRSPEIAHASTARQRQVMILNLEKDDPSLWVQFREAKRLIGGNRHFIQASGRYVRSSVGRINLYPLFTEAISHQLSAKGRAGIIVPSAISMDAYNASLFGWLLQNSRLVSLFDFENTGELFPSVHRSYRFCLLTLAGGDSITQEVAFCYFAHSVEELHNSRRRISLSYREIVDFSPNTLAPPILQRSEDKIIATRCYQRFGVFLDRRDGRISAWNPAIQRMLSLSDNGDFFRRRDELPETIPDEFERLYSGKTIHAFNHRFSTFDGMDWRPTTTLELSDPSFLPVTEYYARRDEVSSRLEDKWPSRWLFGYRDISRATDERTTIAVIIPRTGCDTHCRNIYLEVEDGRLTACLMSNMNAFAFDYLARQKIIGTGMGAGMLEQIPVIPPTIYTTPCPWSGGAPTMKDWLFCRALELTYTAWDLELFAQDCGWSGPPFRWDEERRFLLRCELDAAFFHLYLPTEANGNWRLAEGENNENLAQLKANFPTPRDAVAYIMDTFPIVKRKDESEHGNYRTKNTILEIYDKMMHVIATNVTDAVGGQTTRQYQTPLNPPPGPPIDISRKFLSLYQLDRYNWPIHIHLPRHDWDESLVNAWFDVYKQQWSYSEKDQVFPWDGREAFVYVLIPYLVQEKPDAKFEFYRDAALLASHPENCETLLLDDKLRNEYRLLKKGIALMTFPKEHRVRPRKIREKLQDKKIIVTRADYGSTVIDNIISLPPLPPELKVLLPLILKAADNLEKMQQGMLKEAEAVKNKVRFDLINKELALSVA